MVQIDTDRNHGLVLNEQLAHLHTENTQKKVSNITSDEDIMENNDMFGIKASLVTRFSNNAFFFQFLAQNLKIASEVM